MTLHRSLLVASIGLSLFQVGCLAETDADVEALDEVGMETLELNDPNGGGGQNGLPDPAWEAQKGNLWNATFYAFNAQNPYIAQMNLSADGVKVLQYAAKCAIPQGTTAAGYTGGGILNSTGSWLTGPLQDSRSGRQPKYDLFECMLAHINPDNKTVPIRLIGKAVANNLSQNQTWTFGYSEALWVVYEDANQNLKLEAWPLSDYTDGCGNILDYVKRRACGKDFATNSCDVTIRTDYQDKCTQDMSGYWYCEGHRAIKTKLSYGDWLILYPECPFPM